MAFIGNISVDSQPCAIKVKSFQIQILKVENADFLQIWASSKIFKGIRVENMKIKLFYTGISRCWFKGPTEGRKKYIWKYFCRVRDDIRTIRLSIRSTATLDTVSFATADQGRIQGGGRQAFCPPPWAKRCSFVPNFLLRKRITIYMKVTLFLPIKLQLQ